MLSSTSYHLLRNIRRSQGIVKSFFPSHSPALDASVRAFVDSLPDDPITSGQAPRARREAVEPQGLSGIVQSEIEAVLGDPSLRGERLAQAVSDLGSRHPIEPFRALLGALVPMDMPETEARSIVVAIDDHRASLESLL